MNFNNIEETDASAGIQSVQGIPEASLNTIAMKSRTRYVFYAGEPGERNLGVSQIPYRNGLTFIKRGVVTQVENFAYWDRDQDDRQGMPAQRHPDPRRINEVRQVLYAADIADFLVRLWGMCGLVDLTAAIDLSGDEMARISKALIPVIPPTNRAMRDMITNNLFELGYEEESKGYKVAQQMLAALNAAEYYGRVSLAGKKSEMEMHRVGKDGIAALDDAAKRWCRVLELSVADYEVDSQSFQQAVQQMQTQNSQPIVIQQAPTDPNVLAAAVMAAMNHIKAQQESAAKVIVTGTPDSPGSAFEGLGTDIESMILPKEGDKKKGK